ncbi:hypothetical protein LL06_15065 [Hoeflea sp. BAL378]|uniref:hypothetical protein n=1 Tax=Hoeflea sp. BAL378 TaxID=1547437 RepID=UPI0005129ABC|nr:hypothetical protein [Hoeflea sp. BAL378]KGF68693.1 hypothetical protein LL06_15065 [Hoeflea sp. BAL378]
MTLQETHIYIRCSIGELVARLTDKPATRVSAGSDREVAYSVAGANGQPWFGLLSDLDAPMGHAWTQLLHPAPEDAEGIADTLRTLQVSAEMLESATDWENVPLIALGPITDILRESGARVPPRSYGPLAR